MNRLGVRLALSHLVVAIVGGLTTFLVVGLLAPALFDSGLHLGPGAAGRRAVGRRAAAMGRRFVRRSLRP